ncbi:M56 family metallopeptidase [Parasedimentitalea psychrophila]|uniref:M56 family metallopeptidase n=1 Tax=Parasedimentitalea psychrophila TaxID=2997337 RepID=A0A9Y2NZB5_9RHOB|nr:M56 family metallopeptidase [Parasedimentitalea psychrophila]WIY23431.1 M56 family metallopeptidase [Parasedimentitalea psychrophila]
MQADALLNAYIDLNLLLLVGAGIWIGLRRLLTRHGLGNAFLPQLRLLNRLTVLLVAAPLLALGFTTWVIPHPPNISDMLVSQFLQGHVSLSATRFETLIGLREDLVRSLLTQQAVWARALVLLFAIGAALCSLHVITSVLRLRDCLRSAFLWKKIGRVELLISDTASVAYSTRGLLRLYVVLPSALLHDPRDLRLTIAHELQHFRQRDIECEFLLEMLRPLLFWNPAYFLWRSEVRVLREYACDQALMARPQFDARAYCECLIRACAMAAQDRVLFRRRSPAVALVDRRETRRSATLEQRILAVTAKASQSDHRLSWALLSGLLVGAVLATTLLMQRPSDWSHDRLMLSTIVNLERMANRNSSSSDPVQSFGLATFD